MNLKQLGLKSTQHEFFTESYDENFDLGRVSFVSKNHFKVFQETGEFKAEITQKLVNNDQIPAVGDWVVIHNMDGFHLIIDILPRIIVLKRQSKKHETLHQLIATNIDEVFIVMGFDGDFNLNRLERYIIQVNESGAKPVVILNKLDADDHYEEKLNQVQSRITDIPIYAISVVEQINLEPLRERFYEGMTATLVGSSGVGKSSIANDLIGSPELKVNTTRTDDSKGRHTTTHRGLYKVFPNGIIIDTPGMRSLSLMASEENLYQEFEDIEEIASNCKFADCTHTSEPGCAIKHALENGDLNSNRYENFLKLQKEIDYIRRKSSRKATAEEKEKWKKITKSYRNRNKMKY